MIHHPRNIIFDLGAVLFDISYQRTQEAFAALNLANPELLYSKEKQAEIFDLFETGKITEEEFIIKVNSICNSQLTAEEFRSAWNAMLLGMTQDKIAFLKSLSSRYDLFLLSNTNPTHLKRVMELIDDTAGLSSFRSCFKKLYFSHEIGLRKPHVECFDFVIQDAGIQKQETIFIDDTPQHVEGARRAGITAYHLPENQSVIELCADILT